MGKKAFIAGAIVDLYAYLMFLVVIIVFYLIFKITAAQHTEEMRGTNDLIAGNVFAAAYLRMPVEVEGHQMKMADLIMLADEEASNWSLADEMLKVGAPVLLSPIVAGVFIEGYYLSLFKARTEWYWETTFPDNLCFYFKIKGRNDGENLDHRVAQSGCTWLWTDDDMTTWIGNSKIPMHRFKTMIPAFKEGEMITIYLFYDIETLRNAYGKNNPYIEYARFIAPLGPAGTAVAIAGEAYADVKYGSQAP
ncbi:hypothetical protein ACFL96_06730 [Thermoproteota archaeon]